MDRLGSPWIAFEWTPRKNRQKSGHRRRSWLRHKKPYYLKIKNKFISKNTKNLFYNSWTSTLKTKLSCLFTSFAFDSKFLLPVARTFEVFIFLLPFLFFFFFLITVFGGFSISVNCRFNFGSELLGCFVEFRIASF